MAKEAPLCTQHESGGAGKHAGDNQELLQVVCAVCERDYHVIKAIPCAWCGRGIHRFSCVGERDVRNSLHDISEGRRTIPQGLYGLLGRR